MASIAEVMTVEIDKAMKLTQGYMTKQQQGCVTYRIQALLQPLYHTSSFTVSSQCDTDHPLLGLTFLVHSMKEVNEIFSTFPSTFVSS